MDARFECLGLRARLKTHRWLASPLLQCAMPILLNLEWLRLIVNTLGGLGFPGILVDSQLAFAVWAWWHR